MDVFFYITTIAVIVLTVIGAVALIYFIKILRDIKFIINKAKAGTELLMDEGEKLMDWVKIFGKIFKGSTKGGKRKD